LNFGDRIALRAFSVRELLKWPPSFELNYEWQSLNHTAADLRVFVHFTNSGGQIAYQQDHWPLNGRVRTAEWAPGDIVRERYVVVLPASVPRGTYDILLGWFDVVTGRRLQITGPRAPYKDDRARVAAVTVGRPPNYGWFTVN